jgi:hypothetical protein
VDNLTLRIRWYSYPSWFGLGGVAFFVVLGFFVHGAFWLAVGLAVLWAWMKFGMKIEVTPTEVRFRQWPLPGATEGRWHGLGGVHLYNHRTKHGFGGDAWNGQLMQRAAKAK